MSHPPSFYPLQQEGLNMNIIDNNFEHRSGLDNSPLIHWKCIFYSIREKSMTVRVHAGRPDMRLLQTLYYSK